MAIIANNPINFKAGQSGDWQDLYNSFVESAGDFSSIVCPHCGCQCTFKRCGTYRRFFYNCQEDHKSGYVLDIVILKCQAENCGHEHALFPSWICPYSAFSYPMIVSILNFYYDTANQNLSKTAAAFNLDRAEVRNLIRKYSESQEALKELSSVKNKHLTGTDLLRVLKEKAEQLREFLEDFLHLHKVPFLQCHDILLSCSSKRFTGPFKVFRDKSYIP